MSSQGGYIGVNPQGSSVLANTGTGAAGTVTGTERAQVQANTHDDVAVATNSGLTIRSLAGRVITLTLNLVTTVAAGLMSAADKVKLDGILAGASRLATGALDGLMAAADKAKLDSVNTGVTVTGGWIVSTLPNGKRQAQRAVSVALPATPTAVIDTQTLPFGSLLSVNAYIQMFGGGVESVVVGPRANIGGGFVKVADTTIVAAARMVNGTSNLNTLGSGGVVDLQYTIFEL